MDANQLALIDAEIAAIDSEIDAIRKDKMSKLLSPSEQPYAPDFAHPGKVVEKGQDARYVVPQVDDAMAKDPNVQGFLKHKQDLLQMKQTAASLQSGWQQSMWSKTRGVKYRVK
jgi:hypothetical protein